MSDLFNGYELLLFKKFQSEPQIWLEWKEKLFQNEETDLNFGEIPQSLWFLSVTLHQRRQFLLDLVKDEKEREKKNEIRKSNDTLLTRYIYAHQFTEFRLDSIFKYGEDNKLPKEMARGFQKVHHKTEVAAYHKIFKCSNVKHLSLKYNCLYELPPDIGYLQKLEYLALTNNRLHVQSIPYTLIFCHNLKTLMLDNNLLDALPGFLLSMSSIETVHRHGNHNYFKSTFMWYHTDVHFRIISLFGNSDYTPPKTSTLAFWAAKALIGAKTDFFLDDDVAPVLKDYICEVYDQFNVCHNCFSACLVNRPGFKVITFKNPYLGNTCVPFQHWACSKECAKALEVPARQEQITKARELDNKYEKYIQECQSFFEGDKKDKPVLRCIHRRRHRNSDSEYSFDTDSLSVSASDGYSVSHRKSCTIL